MNGVGNADDFGRDRLSAAGARVPAPLEIYLLIALYYYATISALAWFSRFLERRLPAW